MSFLLCLYFREELVSSRVLFSPLCTGKPFLWKWTGLAGPLIPLCDSISFIKLWHLTCYKGIENSTIWAFQSAGFLLKNGGMYLKATFRSTCLSGLHFNKFLWKHTIYSPKLGGGGMNNGEFISKQILLETYKIQPRLTEREHHHIGVACKNSPGLSFDTCNKEAQAAGVRARCFFPAQKVVAVSPPLHGVGRSEATQTFPWPGTSWLHLHQGRLISFYWLQEMAVNWVNK